MNHDILSFSILHSSFLLLGIALTIKGVRILKNDVISGDHSSLLLLTIGSSFVAFSLWNIFTVGFTSLTNKLIALVKYI